MSFDAEDFLNSSTTEANATFLEPIPEAEYLAVISGVEFMQGLSHKTGEPWARLDLKVELQDPILTEKLGRSPTSKMGVMLDLDNGRIATGPNRNVGLGRVREALNLNAPGQPFSPNMMVGRPCKVAIKHREYNGQIFDEVKAILRAA
jgi:hypothetical protein